MSYEKDIPTKVKCPCGEGFIIAESASNDWGQVKEYPPYIECNNCKNKFTIGNEYYNPKPGHDKTIYYLVNNDTKERIKLNF